MRLVGVGICASIGFPPLDVQACFANSETKMGGRTGSACLALAMTTALAVATPTFSDGAMMLLWRLVGRVY